MQKEKEYVISDRYGYWLRVWASSPDEAIRFSSNLAPGANLEYATTEYVGEPDELADIGDNIIEIHNCSVAHEIGGNDCQCGCHGY